MGKEAGRVTMAEEHAAMSFAEQSAFGEEFVSWEDDVEAITPSPAHTFSSLPPAHKQSPHRRAVRRRVARGAPRHAPLRQ